MWKCTELQIRAQFAMRSSLVPYLSQRKLILSQYWVKDSCNAWTPNKNAKPHQMFVSYEILRCDFFLVSSLLFFPSFAQNQKSESDFRLFLIPDSISLCSDSLFATETKFTSSKGSKGEIRDTQRAKRIAPNFDVLLHQAFPLDIYILYITYEAFVFTVSSQFDVKNEILNKCTTCIENVKIGTYY